MCFWKIWSFVFLSNIFFHAIQINIIVHYWKRKEKALQCRIFLSATWQLRLSTEYAEHIFAHGLIYFSHFCVCVKFCCCGDQYYRSYSSVGKHQNWLQVTGLETVIARYLLCNNLNYLLVCDFWQTTVYCIFVFWDNDPCTSAGDVTLLYIYIY